MPRATIIPFQPQLPPRLPTIEGNVDYRDFRDQLLFIEQMLLTSGLETQLMEADLQRWMGPGQLLKGSVLDNGYKL